MRSRPAFNGMKYLGIDYGSKRVGLAVGTSEDSIAFPRKVIPAGKGLLDEIEKYIQDEGIDEVVIGESRDLDGGKNKIQEEIEDFVGDLTLRTGIPIHYELEYLTSHQAQKIQGKNDKLDASAASIILQSYLEGLKHKK